MNKAELVDAISEKIDASKRETDTILTAIVEEIMAAVVSGNKVTLVGFGSFEPRERQARSGRNPRTGEAMTISATVESMGVIIPRISLLDPDVKLSPHPAPDSIRLCLCSCVRNCGMTHVELPNY